MHGTIFQPVIPETWQEYFYSILIIRITYNNYISTLATLVSYLESIHSFLENQRIPGNAMWSIMEDSTVGN